MTTAPDRIYGWLDSQMSIARHYGGLKLQGVDYVIAYNEPDQPLIRIDVLAHEAKQNRTVRKSRIVADKAKQEDLL